jgi:hypothetical protein
MKDGAHVTSCFSNHDRRGESTEIKANLATEDLAYQVQWSTA